MKKLIKSVFPGVILLLAVLLFGFGSPNSDSNIRNSENVDRMEVHVGINGYVKKLITVGGRSKWVGISGATVTITTSSDYQEVTSTNSSGYYSACIDDLASGDPELPWTVHVSCAEGTQTKTVQNSSELNQTFYWCGTVTAARKDFNFYPGVD